MSFDHLNISRKLFLGFAAVVTIVGSMCLALFISLQSIKTAVAQNDFEVAQLKDADAALMAMVERTNAFRGLVANGDKSFQEKIDAQTKTFDDAIADWTRIAPNEAAQIADIKAAGSIVSGEQDSQIA